MSKDYKVLLDEKLDLLQIKVVEQLIEKVSDGEDLRAAIDFLRLHKRSVPESAVIGSNKDPNDYFNEMLETVMKEKDMKLRR